MKSSHGRHAVRARDLLRGVDVTFQEIDVRVFLREGFVVRGDCVAWATPVRYVSKHGCTGMMARHWGERCVLRWFLICVPGSVKVDDLKT